MATLLIPLAFLLALLAALLIQLRVLKGTADLTPADVAKALQDFIDGTGGDWDWDDFESVPITDPVLDQIRREAAAAGPPGADIEKLKELLGRVQTIIDSSSSRRPG